LYSGNSATKSRPSSSKSMATGERISGSLETSSMRKPGRSRNVLSASAGYFGGTRGSSAV
jgi:hypothetical protein